MDDPTGKLLGERYELHEQLSRGMTSTVHAAIDRLDRTECVIKLLSERDARDSVRRARFMQEIAILRVLQSDAVVRLLADDVTPDGVPYFVMEKLVGEDLRRTLGREIRLPWPKTCEVLRQVCEAMRAIHRSGFVHGDLKPENVFLSHAPAPRVQLLDFGNACPQSYERSGESMGTPEYLAPEWEQSRTFTMACDIYAWGVMAYECITGRLPYRGADDGEMLLPARESGPLPFAEVVPWLTLPPALEQLILRSLHPSPGRRYNSFDELVRDLNEIIDTVGRFPTAQRMTRQLSRSSSLILRKWFIAVSVLGIAASATWYFLHTHRPRSPNGRSTLVWQLKDSGRIKAMLVERDKPKQIFDLGGLSERSFRVVGAGDFNADGQMDLLWYRSSTHMAALWYVSLGANRPVRTGSEIWGYGAPRMGAGSLRRSRRRWYI